MIRDRLPRPGEPSGATAPERSLPTTPARLAGAPARLAARLPRPSGFPWTPPTRPATLPVPPAERTLGVHYDTEWARRYPARLARAALTEAVARPAVAALAAPRVEGLDRIEHLHGPVIFAANHASHVDTPLLVHAIPDRWRHHLAVASAADYFFDTRLKAAAFAFLLNAVPIERQRVDRSSARRLSALIEEGWSLLIYPEGGRTPDGWGQPHQRGPAWLAERTGRPIVPIHVSGTRRILPRHATRPRPGHTSVHFGRPLRASDGGARELAARVEAAIAALADEQATDWWSATRRAAAGATPALTGPGDAGAWRRAWVLGEGRRRAGAPARWPKV
ncbi:MAG TPA: lysophospholipid acyltransferase family protein [Acidimicrobiales bacterium]|nr:lysophospholipid acyltransferase family protein [Acidimicrobiales bacterium]